MCYYVHKYIYLVLKIEAYTSLLLFKPITILWKLAGQEKDQDPKAQPSIQTCR